MKVFYLTNIPSPYRVAFWNLLGTHCELTVVFEKFNERNREWAISGVGENFKAGILDGVTLGIQYHFNPGIIKHLREYQYDVYVIGGFAAPTDMLAIRELKRQKKPFILSADGGFPRPGDDSITGAIKRNLISSAAKYMSSGTVCDEYLKCYGARPGDLYRYHFSSVFENEIGPEPLSDIRKAALRNMYGLKNNVVISVGQFIHRKGFDLLLDMWGHFRRDDTTLLIVGGGPQKRMYQNIIRHHDLKNVVIIDFLQRAKLFELYRLADLFVFPTRYDIWGLVPGEAMANGLPVIASHNAASIHDLITDGVNGLVEELEYPIRWARDMEDLIEDQNTRRELSEKAVETMRSYTIEAMVRDYMLAFNDITRL